MKRKAKIHWIIYFQPILLFGLGGFVYSQFPEYEIGAYLLLLGGVLILLNRFWYVISNSLTIDDSYVTLRKGVFSTVKDRIPIEKIENFRIFKSLLGNIFNYGTIRYGNDSSYPDFKYVSDPDSFLLINKSEKPIQNNTQTKGNQNSNKENFREAKQASTKNTSTKTPLNTIDNNASSSKPPRYELKKNNPLWKNTPIEVFVDFTPPKPVNIIDNTFKGLKKLTNSTLQYKIDLTDIINSTNKNHFDIKAVFRSDSRDTIIILLNNLGLLIIEDQNVHFIKEPLRRGFFHPKDYYFEGDFAPTEFHQSVDRSIIVYRSGEYGNGQHTKLVFLNNSQLVNIISTDIGYPFSSTRLTLTEWHSEHSLIEYFDNPISTQANLFYTLSFDEYRKKRLINIHSFDNIAYDDLKSSIQFSLDISDFLKDPEILNLLWHPSDEIIAVSLINNHGDSVSVILIDINIKKVLLSIEGHFIPARWSPSGTELLMFENQTAKSFLFNLEELSIQEITNKADKPAWAREVIKSFLSGSYHKTSSLDISTFINLNNHLSISVNEDYSDLCDLQSNNPELNDYEFYQKTHDIYSSNTKSLVWSNVDPYKFSFVKSQNEKVWLETWKLT